MPQIKNDATPIVLQQNRLLLMFVALFGFVALGIGMDIKPGSWRIDGLIPMEWALIPGGLGIMLFGLGKVLRPGRLVLTAADLEYRSLLGTRTEPWENILAVGLRTQSTRLSSVTTVFIRFRSGSTVHLGSGWPLGADDLARLIESMRREARSAPSTDLRSSILAPRSGKFGRIG